MRPFILPLLACVLALAGACRTPAPGRAAGAPRLARELATPAAPGSGEPNLATAADGSMYLTWIEPAGGLGAPRHRLMLARRRPGGEWAPPQRIAEGANWFVNWADFPSLAVLPDSTLFAHWLERSGSGGYSYGIRVSVSRDGGGTWSAPVVPHRDGTATEHGFVSFVPWPDGGSGAGRMGMVWLDGRNPEGMRLMSTTIDDHGRLGPEATLDDRVCDCCQTAATRTDAGVLVAYRDRSPGEVRDVSVLRTAPAGWTQPQTVGADGWQIHGCPVNGPALASRGQDAALAWFAAPRDEPRVWAAFSRDGGAHFGPPVRVDDGKPVGRVDLVLLDDGEALVSWLESAGGRAELRVRRVRADGVRGEGLVVAGSSAERSTGFPRMKRAGAEVVVAWRDAADPPRVRTALIDP